MFEGFEGGVANDIHDGAAGEGMVTGDFGEVEFRSELGLRGEALLPKLESFFGAGNGEVNDGFEATGEGFVEVVAAIGGEYGDAVESFDALEEEGDFLVGVAVVSVFGFAPFAKEGIGFIEEENPVFVLGLVENFGEIFFGFADVLGDDEGEVNLVDVAPGCLAE